MKGTFQKTRTVLDCVPFKVEEVRYVPASASDRGPTEPHYRLSCPDWVNILPITKDGQAVLIRQMRSGSNSIVLETPGGVVHEGERDLTLSILRELEEETGYTTQRVLYLGASNPNPAIMTNKIHFFLGLGCVLAEERKHFPDPGEMIEIELVPAQALGRLVRQGQMNHALSALCVLMSAPYLTIDPPEQRGGGPTTE